VLGDTIGVRIRAARVDRAISQAALARLVGVNTVSAWRWETGRIVPSVRRLQTICDALGISVAQLLRGV